MTRHVVQSSIHHRFAHETVKQFIAFLVTARVRLLVRFVHRSDELRLEAAGHLSEFGDLRPLHLLSLLRAHSVYPLHFGNEALFRVEIYDMVHHVELIVITQR